MLKCDRCLWADQCHTVSGECEYYTPVNERESLDEYIEARANEYRQDWMRYAREYDD